MLIQEYSNNWIDFFLKIKEKLESILPKNTKVEHIGSTSIPNLAAKDIIDIDIIYFKETDFGNEFENIKEILTQIGYFHNGNQGIKEREVFKRVKKITPKQENSIEKNFLDTINHHLYVCPSTSQELQRHLLFRNYLRQNESARIDYQTLKYNLAKKANQDKKKYAEMKEKEAKEFINSIIEVAKKEL